MGPNVARLVCTGVAVACISLPSVAQDGCKDHYRLTSPAACKWVRTGDLNTPRLGHTATLLRDGSVLVVGGVRVRYHDANGIALPPDPHTVERYDPDTGSWRYAAPLRWGRSGHTATLLDDGRVLVAGSESLLPGIGMPEVYDPVADRWTDTTLLQDRHERAGTTGSLLPDGMVMLAGGVDMSDISAPTEIYDPRTDRWSFGPALVTNRFGQTATPLPDGRILFAGGYEDSFYSSPRPVPSAELFDAAVGRFVVAGAPLFAHWGHTATVLPDSNVVFAGGVDLVPRAGATRWSSRALHATEVFDVREGRWVRGHDMNHPRHGHTTTLLDDGALLVVGGRAALAESAQVHASTELTPIPYAQPIEIESLHQARYGHTATRLQDGSVLVVGGNGANHKPLRSAERFGALPVR